MKKIVFGITGLTIGGAERVLIDIVNKLSEKDDYDITIFTLYAKGELEKELNKKIHLKHLNNFSFSDLKGFRKLGIICKTYFRKKQIYRNFIEKKNYDIEIAFLEGPITRIFSTKNKKNKKISKKDDYKVKKIAWIHNDISKVFGRGPKAKIKRIVDRNIYEKYNTLIFVSLDNMDSFNRLYDDMDLPHERVIHNFLNESRIKELSKEKVDIPFKEEEINIVQVSRLVEQKAIDRLIEAHKKVMDQKFKHHIYILGDGPERAKLENKIKELKIEKTFTLLGQKENPYPYMKNADYFCLLSNYEGYPMVLEEAKILNKFIGVTDTASRETIIDYKEYSKIAENSLDGVERLLKDLVKNKNNYLRKNINYKYDNERIVNSIIRQIES